LSGGGSNGAWEAGVIWGLLHYGNPDEYKWDVVSGVSAGSVNTAGIGVWAPGEELKGSEWLVNTWRNLTNASMYKLWSPHEVKAWALYHRPSIYDTSPGLEMIKEILAAHPDGFKRKVAVSAVDANTGDKVTFTDENVEFKDFHTVVIGSASIPMEFPPTQFKDHLLIDGGTAYGLDVQATIDRCREITGNDDSKITIDFLVCGSEETIT